MDKHIREYIRSAIKDDLLEIHYQPQFSLVGGCFEMTGVEALIRPDTSICHIDKLIAVAIESEQMCDLGYWILEQATKQVRVWEDKDLITGKFTVSVNVAGPQLQDPDFCKKVFEITIDAEIYPGQVTIELTESSLIDDANIAKIYKLSGLGFNISIDDFGTGYSSFGRLKHLPVDEIKIDKTFVDDITKTHQDVALITAMFQLTAALEKFTIVEGVENVCQYEMLRDIGFTCFQGYFFDKAQSAEELEQTLTLINSLHFRSYQQ